MAQLNQLIGAVIETVRSPRLIAQQVMLVELPRRQRWEVLLLVAVLSAIFASISQYANILVVGEQGTVMKFITPVALAISQLVVMIVMAYSMFLVGRWAGGAGSLDDAILLVSWMQFILICLQIIQIIAVLVSPVLSFLIGLFGLVLVFVLLTLFVSEMHGFKSVSRVFFSVLFVMLLLATFVRFVFNLFGFDIIGVL